MPFKKRLIQRELEEPKHEQDVDMSSDDSSDDSDNDQDGRHPDAYTGNEEIQVEFEGRNPTEADLPGISQLLKQKFLKAHMNLNELADIIIGQGYIGSVITQCEDEDGPDDEDDDEDMYDSNVVFGITTALNLTQRKEMQCIQDMIQFLHTKANENMDKDKSTEFIQMLESTTDSVGLLLNERFINIPPQISVPMLENLQKELLRAVEKKKLDYFEKFIIVIKFYRQLAKGNKPAEDIFTNGEEEAICKFGTMSFEYSVEDEADTGVTGDWLEGDAAMKPYRRVVVIPTSKFSEMITSIKEFIE